MIKKIIVAIMIMSSTAFGLEIIQTNNITFKGKVTVDTNTVTEGIISTSPSQITFNAMIRINTNGLAYDDMLSSASAAYVSGVTDIVADDTLGGKSFHTHARTNASQDHLTFSYQTPHRRKSFTHLDPHVHFWQTNADQTNIWYAFYAWVPLGRTNVAEVQIGPAVNVLPYTPGTTMHQLASFPEMNNTNAGISSTLRIKLYRDGNFGTGDITVTDLDCHYEVNSFGSDQELSKK